MSKKGFIAEYEVEIRKAWSSPKMVDYCLRKTDNVVRLDNGYLIPIDKESIEKDFCFGYSLSRYDSESYDRANDMARYASESEAYFFEQNMKSFRRVMECFDEGLYPVASRLYYSGGDMLKSVRFYKGWEICDLFGGSCYLDEVKGKYVKDDRGNELYILNDKDIADLRAGYELAMNNHEKRVRTYLKKYGTKHVNSWSYWQDA